jgi:cytochrome P450
MKRYPGSIPTISTTNALSVLKDLTSQRSLLAGLEAIHRELGDTFEINFPGFKSIVLSGPAATREILVTNHRKLKWRNELDPVTRLLRHGILVEDGEFHDALRSFMEPTLRRSRIVDYLPMMLARTDQTLSNWQDGSIQDMLVEMRQLALTILVDTLFSVDISPDLPHLWGSILKILAYISPGLWLITPVMPRPGYQKGIDELDDYLYTIIRERRRNGLEIDDMLGDLIRLEDLSDDLIRDQLLTMLIAGHDTSTALLSWSLYLLSSHPRVMKQTKVEVDEILKDRKPSIKEITRLVYLDQVIKETMRLYPPIHVANRIADNDLHLQGCPIPKGERIMLSYYLTHRDAQVWEEPGRFKPERFGRGAAQSKQPPFSFLPFGGGPRNCIGAAFAQVEVKVILARILQRFNLELVSPQVGSRMAATLEPHPGVFMRVSRRNTTIPGRQTDLKREQVEA